MIDATARFPQREAALAATLATATFATRRIGHGAFGFGLHDTGDALGRATLEDEWVRLELPGDIHALWPSAAELLEQNADLPGPAKWAWPHGAKLPALLVDCWFGDGAAPAQGEVCAGCASLSAAAAPPEGRFPEAGAVPATPLDSGLCAELIAAGWKSHRRDDGSVAVDLDTGADFFQAHVGGRGHAWLLCRSDVAVSEGGDADVHEALARLLLGASATLRLVRGASIAAEERRVHRFEVGLAADADARALDRALSALTVACATYGPTARALTRPELARVYAAVRGWSRPARTIRRVRQGATGQGG